MFRAVPPKEFIHPAVHVSFKGRTMPPHKKIGIRKLYIRRINQDPPPTCYVADVRIQLRSEKDRCTLEHFLAQLREIGGAEILREGLIDDSFDNVTLVELIKAEFRE